MHKYAWESSVQCKPMALNSQRSECPLHVVGAMMLKLYTDGTARARGVGRCNLQIFWRRSGGVIHNNGNAARSRLADGRMRGKQGNKFVSNMALCRTGGWGSRSPTERGGNRELGMFPRARWARKTRSSGTCCRRQWSIGADGIA